MYVKCMRNVWESGCVKLIPSGALRAIMVRNGVVGTACDYGAEWMGAGAYDYGAERREKGRRILTLRVAQQCSIM